MECILEGPKEAALTVTWHPVRSVLLSVGGSGRVGWAGYFGREWVGSWAGLGLGEVVYKG